jgi:hypothetical protein
MGSKANKINKASTGIGTGTGISWSEYMQKYSQGLHYEMYIIPRPNIKLTDGLYLDTNLKYLISVIDETWTLKKGTGKLASYKSNNSYIIRVSR